MGFRGVYMIKWEMRFLAKAHEILVEPVIFLPQC